MSKITPEEQQAIAHDVGRWIWGTIQGNFAEQQTVSQIIVDAAIGMIPIVGDVTAVRDLIAVTIRLVDHPEKRDDPWEWVTLVVLLFALIPVAGGVIKGIGKLACRAGAKGVKNVRLLREMVAIASRLGDGNAVRFIRDLRFQDYLPQLMAKWSMWTTRLSDTMGALIRRAGAWMPAGMVARLKQLRDGIAALARKGHEMIPDAVKTLDKRMREIQKAIYRGDWHEIGSAASGKLAESVTREVEARIAAKIAEQATAGKAWPKNKPAMFAPVDGWPDMGAGKFVDRHGAAWAIEGFSGEMKAVRLEPGTRIYRIVDSTSNPAGLWWCLELPEGGEVWRKEWAVLEAWNKNRYYVELVVPDSGLYVWQGRVSGQVQARSEAVGFGQYLEGGAEQIMVDFSFPANAPAAAHVSDRVPTNWGDTVKDVGLPDENFLLELLGQNEVESKLIETGGRFGAAGIRLRRIGRDEHQVSGDAH
jgi:hypothetical protein